MVANRKDSIKLSAFFVSLEEDVLTLKMPSVFCIHENYSEVRKFLDSVAEAIVHLKYRVIVDMNSVCSVTAGAALLLVAEAMRARHHSSSLNKGKVLTFELPDDPVMRNFIEQTTLFEALKPAIPRQLADVKEGEEIAFVTGSNPSLDLSRLDDVLCRRLGVEKLPNNVFRAINEAFLNLTEHAYKDVKERRRFGNVTVDTITKTTHAFLRNRWWVYAVVTEETSDCQKVLFLVYDMGHSIPYTIFANYAEYMPTGTALFSRTVSDDDLIVHAFKHGITCTGRAGRGRGTGDMKRPLCEEEDNLLVLSRSGKVRFGCTGDVLSKSSVEPAINGTLLVWQLHVQKGAA